MKHGTVKIGGTEWAVSEAVTRRRPLRSAPCKSETMEIFGATWALPKVVRLEPLRLQCKGRV